MRYSVMFEETMYHEIMGRHLQLHKFARERLHVLALPHVSVIYPLRQGIRSPVQNFRTVAESGVGDP